MAHRLPLLEWHAQKYGKAQPQRGEVKAGRQPRRGLGDRTRGLLAVGPLESRGSLAVRGFVGGRAGRPGWQISAGSDASQRGAADCFGSDDDGARPDHIRGRAPHRGVVDLLQVRVSSRIDVPAMSRLAAAALSALLISYAPPAAAQETRPDVSSSTRDAGAMPERRQRLVAPSPSSLGQPPAPGGYTSVLKAEERVPIDPQKRYDLVELIDLAQRTNPETRVAWEGARQAAIATGLVQSEDFPVLALPARAGRKTRALPAAQCSAAH